MEYNSSVIIDIIIVSSSLHERWYVYLTEVLSISNAIDLFFVVVFFMDC